jgi:hypothetical protein
VDVKRTWWKTSWRPWWKRYGARSQPREDEPRLQHYRTTTKTGVDISPNLTVGSNNDGAIYCQRILQ